MPKILYNEGRVVGYSAYELYIKHALSVDPNTQPASELEWLASNIATGTSMLLRVGTDSKSGPHYREISFPTDTRLCAANTIIGSFFLGQGYVPEDTSDTKDVWATKVIDYGKLINNSDNSSPTTSSTSVPPSKFDVLEDLSPTDRNKLKEYMKIVDGIVVQPGTWTANDAENKPPTKDFSPKLSTYPKLRLFFSDKVETPFFILLTGFTLRTVIKGVSGTDTATNTASPQDGDFLGPAAYPWANKVVFSVPPSFVNYFIRNNYSRKLPATEVSQSVNTTPIIDMNKTDPNSYYADHDTEATVPINVTDLSTYGNGAAVLTIYQRDEILPPALYGTKVSSTGNTYLNPIDTVAPGTLKLYHGDDGTKSKVLESKSPQNYAFTRDGSSYVVSQINQSGVSVPVSDTYTSPIYGTLTSSEPIAPFFHEQHNSGDPTNYVGFGVTLSRRISGLLSDKFRQDCGIEYGSELLEAILNTQFPLENGSYSKINTSMCKDLLADPVLGSKYYYVLQGQVRSESGSRYISTWTLVPIMIESNRLDYVEKVYGHQNVSLPWIVPPYSTSDTTNFKYLGTWWNSETISDHPSIGDTLREMNPTISYIQDPNRSLPANDGDKSWETVYRNTRLRDIFTDDQLNGSQLILKKDDGKDFIVNYTRIHPDYRSMTLYELLEIAKVRNVTTKQIITFQDASKTKYEGMALTKYFALTDGTSISLEEGLTIQGTVNMSTSINESNYSEPVKIPIPSNYISSEGPQGVVNISGNHQTLALSLADKSGSPYNMTGTSGTITDMTDGNIHWSDLLEALINNKSIDILHSNAFIKRFHDMFSKDLTAGVGISIVWNDKTQQFTITNTMPYNAAGIGYTRLVQGDSADFVVTAYNGFRTYNNAANENNRWLDDIQLGVRVLPSIDVDSDGDPLSVAIIVDGIYHKSATEDFRLGKPKFGQVVNKSTLKGFYWPSTSAVTAALKGTEAWPSSPGYAFKHSDPLSSSSISSNRDSFVNTGTADDPAYRYAYGQLSHIFGIIFKGNYEYLNESKYKFRDTTEGGSGIWNIVDDNGTCGGSWMAMGGLSTGANANRATTIVGYAGSYADGYNTQMNIWDSDTSDETGRGKNLWSNHINFTVSGIFYQT